MKRRAEARFSAPVCCDPVRGPKPHGNVRPWNLRLYLILAHIYERQVLGERDGTANRQ